MMERLSTEKHDLVIDNLDLVHFVLNKQLHIHRSYNEYEDYFQEGCIGLILAAIRFDESKGFQFSTYAISMIKGHIYRYRRDKGNFVRIPRNKYNLVMQVINLVGQGMSVTDIVEMTGYSHEDIWECIQISCIDSLDKEISMDSSGSISAYDMVGSYEIDLEDILSAEHITKSIIRVKENLKDKLHQDIWEEYIWAIYYGERLNQQYFADKYGVSQAHVSRILKKCKERFVKVIGE